MWLAPVKIAPEVKAPKITVDENVNLVEIDHQIENRESSKEELQQEEHAL